MKTIIAKIKELLDTQDANQLVTELGIAQWKLFHAPTSQHIEKQWITVKMICLLRCNEDNQEKLIDMIESGTVELQSCEKSTQEIYDAIWTFGDYDGDMWVESLHKSEYC